MEVDFVVNYMYHVKDYTRIASIFLLPIVLDWTNVFIVIWLPYVQEEQTKSLSLAPDCFAKC